MWIEVPGSRIYCEHDGDESLPAVLLWNGARCTLRMWDLVVPRLTEGFRVVRFEIRGTGRSTPSEDPEAQNTLERYTAGAVAVLDALSIETTHVWAMAWGSRAALAFASLHSDRAGRVARYDASVGPADVEAQAAGRRGPAYRFLFANSQFTRFQYASTYCGRAFR